MSHRLERAEASDGIQCSFCGRTPDEGRLVTAPEVAICERCVARASDLLDAEDSDDAEDGRPLAAVRRAAPGAVRVRLLGEADVATLLPMDDVIDTMKGALTAFSARTAVQPVRLVLPIGGGRGFLGAMPAELRDPEAVGTKLVTVFPGNADLSLPTHAATILLFDPRTGRVVSVMDGRLITEMRTAAVSALSVALLAREEAAVLAILGSGVQARSHLEALERVWTFTEARVWSPTPAHREAFAAEMAEVAETPLTVAASAEDAVRDADVIVLATSSVHPVLENAWVKEGAHVVAVGACRPDQREIDPALLVRARLFVDSRDAALVESGDVVLSISEGRFTEAHIVGELGELLGKRIEGRTSAAEITIFKSLGLAVEDVAAATLAFRRAVAQDIGVEHEL